jgi:hypothetical protein
LITIGKISEDVKLWKVGWLTHRGCILVDSSFPAFIDVLRELVKANTDIMREFPNSLPQLGPFTFEKFIGW